MATTKSAAKTAKAAEKYDGFTDDERAAMKERAKELKSARRSTKGDEEPAVLAKIAEMQEPDRTRAERIHAIVRANAPQLAPKLWYGMPAYARDGKVLCFYQAAQKFNTRYATLGFNDVADLDDGTMWPTAFALTELSPADEAMIGELVKKAVS
ncbi:DUF1801 domain-containing protein [Catellatospora citrea]|uniref:iron chaperone n=1 Tax=Catellatospora citrea TaxID=53366 RepID=UPI00340117DD